MFRLPDQHKYEGRPVQITVDTSQDSVQTLLMAAGFIRQIAEGLHAAPSEDFGDRRMPRAEMMAAVLTDLYRKPPAPPSGEELPDPSTVGFGTDAVPAGTFPLPPAAPTAATAPVIVSTAVPAAAGVPLPPSIPPEASAADGVPPLDKNGFPWDARIHAEGRKRNKDDTWRYRRNLNDAAKQNIETELRTIFPAPVAAAPPSTAPSAAVRVPVPPPPAAIPLPPSVTLPSVPSPPAIPAPPGLAGTLPAGAGQTAMTYEHFVTRIVSPGIQGNKFTQDELLTAIAKVTGGRSLQLLGHKPELIPAVLKVLREEMRKEV